MSAHDTVNLGLSKPRDQDREWIPNRKVSYSLQQLDDRWTSTTPSTQALGDAASAGSSLNVARADHKHAMPTLASVRIPGMIAMWGINTPPTGWLICDGSSLLRSGTYASLFAVIGVTYGAADGTHFNLPDFRNYSPIGAGVTYTLATTYGAATANIQHTHTGPSHTHTIDHDHPNTTTTQGSPRDETADTTGSGNVSDNLHTHDLDLPNYTGSSGSDGTGNTGTGGSTTQSILHPVLAIHFIIAY